MTLPGAAAPSRRGLGIAYVVVSALAFGAMAIFARRAYADGVDTLTLLALRFAIATPVMLAIALLARARWPRGRDIFGLVALGGIGYGGQAMSFFTALTLAPAGLVALLLYLYPAIVAVLAVLFLRERLDARKALALVLALAGTAATAGPALGGGGSAQPAGVALALLSAAIYAVYIIAGSRLGRRVDARAMSTIVIASAAVVYGVAGLVFGFQLPRTLAGFASIAAIALLTVTAIALFFAGLARIGPTQAATLSTVEPLFTVALAAVMLDERILPVQLAGGVLIIVAVVLLARGGRAA